MRAIDTNVVARYLLHDDPRQSAVASDVLRAGVVVPLTVILETGWLLSSRYRQPRDVVAATLIDFLDLPFIRVDDAAGIGWALDRYRAGADLADMLHLVAASSAGEFATFDRGIAENAGANAPIGIKTLV